ncbi:MULTISPECIES: LysR family transcriptional regulator [unclassified Mesorhizobium]|uniref:LysR family transcriptional regulator n=1 Tax=unclassified Mesorhizobium TaxID=325217 RepID=UPI000F75A0C8|nr:MULTISPECIES: LysR family transcriptional regulator [unclassified Mesorhizobium]AZO73471.1 LysR family transcriptional regulator [Mesorhizobium sp. M1D.F.Ca.ET.043.01.1.1]RWX72328.1 LysR family transcriptional regulator [Mesorhizobium sp. M2A.F.Ca.ET.039.01.1.1]
MDRLTSMTAFVKAVDLGSFEAAASALQMSGPMVGKHVRFLEERLGVRLLNRTTRRQSLTDIGKIYYERCRIILTEAEAADALAADQLSEPRGKLRVTMPVHFGRQCAAPVMLNLAKRYPGLELDLSFTDRLVDLAEDGFDLAVRTGELTDKAGLMARRLAQQHMIVCASPGYIAERGLPQDLSDIMQHETVVYWRAGPVPPWLFPRDGEAPFEIVPSSRFRFDDLNVIADAAAAGAGLAWLPSWLVRAYIANGSLRDVFPTAPSFPYDAYAVWLRAPLMPVKLRLAIDELAASLPRLM